MRLFTNSNEVDTSLGLAERTAYGLFCAVLGGMNPDTLDYGEWKFGKNVSGMGVAAVSFGQKVGTGLGGALFGLILDWRYYDGTAAIQAESKIRDVLPQKISDI